MFDRPGRAAGVAARLVISLSRAFPVVSSARRFALVTYAADPDVQPDDRALVEALHRRGVTSVACVWTDPRVDWTAFDAVVLRSTWDYFLEPDAFGAWLDARDAEGTRVLNPTSVVRWNLDKRYLRDLAARDIAIVPTRWVERGSSVALDALLDERGWDDVVVKPAVSGGAHETWRSTRERAATDTPRLRALASSGTVMVQPFLPEIERDGEWSLLFFAGRYSHAARKRPRAGDFRVQRQFGGVYGAEAAPPVARAAAEQVIAATLEEAGLAPAELPYARVDGCVVDGRFLLMELEVVEPALFFAQAPGAADRCAAALLDAPALAPAGLAGRDGGVSG